MPKRDAAASSFLTCDAGLFGLWSDPAWKQAERTRRCYRLPPWTGWPLRGSINVPRPGSQ